MPKKFFRQSEKKINFVIFSNEQKTYHLKMNYYLFKFLICIFVLSFIYLFYISFVAINLSQQNSQSSEYIVNLKNDSFQHYLEAHFSNKTADEINENSSSKTVPQTTPQVASINFPTNATNKTIIPPLHPLPNAEIKKVPVNIKTSEPETLTPIEPSPKDLALASSIDIEQEALSFHNNKIHFTFVLVNPAKNKEKAITGAVCAQFELTNSNNQNKTVGYPIDLKLDSLGHPSEDGCVMGEHVKFSRLRPMQFDLQLLPEQIPSALSQNWNVQRVSIYFLEKNTQKVIRIKEIRYSLLNIHGK